MSEKRDISDDQLLDLLQNPRTMDQGFRLLMLKYQERLYWQIRKLVVEHEDANDVLQNCFIKFYKSIASFQRKSKLYTWLYRIATNEAITYLNKRNRRSATSIDNEELRLANTLEADTYFDGEQVQVRLEKALLSLPDKQHEVFRLRYFEERSYQEISDLLGTSVGGLKASYHHAVKKIESFLREVEI